MPEEEKVDPQWIIGFTEGEGSFYKISDAILKPGFDVVKLRDFFDGRLQTEYKRRQFERWKTYFQNFGRKTDREKEYAKRHWDKLRADPIRYAAYLKKHREDVARRTYHE